MDINDGYVWIGTIGTAGFCLGAMRYHGAVQLLSDWFTAPDCAPLPLCPSPPRPQCPSAPPLLRWISSPVSPHPCLHCNPAGAGSDAFRWMSRTLEPTNTNFSLSVISQFCAVVFQLLTSRRVRLNVTVLVSPGSSSTSSKPRRTPQGLSSPPSWTYYCVLARCQQTAVEWSGFRGSVIM